MKTLKQCFTQWFNKKHERCGHLWEDRFKSSLVESGHAARTVAAYIDLNPVRAALVDDPKDYRWCSYGEAVAGNKRSREGLQRVMFEAGRAQGAEQVAAEELLSWRQASHHYRKILYFALNRNNANLDAEDTPQLSETDALLCRLRAMIDGVALGSSPFVENIFGCYRGRFGKKRKTGARKLQQVDTRLRTLRNLQPEPQV